MSEIIIRNTKQVKPQEHARACEENKLEEKQIPVKYFSQENQLSKPVKKASRTKYTGSIHHTTKAFMITLLGIK